MEETIISIVSEVLETNIGIKSTVNEMENWDSLKMMQILMLMEEKEIYIKLEKINKIKSVEDLILFAEIK